MKTLYKLIPQEMANKLDNEPLFWVSAKCGNNMYILLPRVVIGIP